MNVLGSVAGHLDVEHPYFSKDYQKPKKVIAPEVHDEYVPNVNNFFDNLPQKLTKGKQSRCTIAGDSKRERQAKAMKKLMLRKQAMEEKLAKMQQQWAEEEVEARTAAAQGDKRAKQGNKQHYQAPAQTVTNLIGNLHE